jgi:hypothetical protein
VMASEVVKRAWIEEQRLLGLARDTPSEKFARGGLAALAVDPTVRIVVLPGDLSAKPVPALDPASVIPAAVTLPGGYPLPYHNEVRGTSSGYIGLVSGDDGRLRRFDAVYWHGGVDFFAGDDAGLKTEISPGSCRKVIYLQKCMRWAWAALAFQRQIIHQYHVAGPFRVIFGVADTAGAVLRHFAAGWSEANYLDQSTALEDHVLFLDDLDVWPDETGIQDIVIHFGARLDLAFGGGGKRHLDRTGPEAGQLNLR